MLCLSYTLEINLLQNFFYVKMNHFKAHLMVSSRDVDYKVLRMAIQLEIFLFLVRRQNGKYNGRNFT